MKKFSTNNKDVQSILSNVESVFGKKPTVATDFTKLSDNIFDKTGELISSSTLKRLWGYVSKEVTPRLYTLDIFAKYCNYPNWEVFREMEILHQSDSSGIINQKRIRIKELNKNDRLTICWVPDREIICTYQGEGKFEITESKNSKLESGITFTTGDIYFNVPLYMKDLEKDGFEIGDYVAGKSSGITEVGIK